MTSELAAVVTYAVLTGLWGLIVGLYLKLRRGVSEDPLLRALLAVLALDALKTLLESVYFGLVWAANYRLLPESFRVLGRGEYLTLVKLVNVGVAVVILGWLIRRWVPTELAARQAQRDEEKRLRTQLERTLAAVQLSEERFRLAATASRDAVWDWDLRSDACFTTPRIAELMEVDPSAWPMTTEPWWRFVHPDDRRQLEEQVQDVIAGRRDSFEARFRMVSSSGRVLTMSSTALALRDETGTPSRLIGVTRDLTADVEAEQARLSSQKLESIGLLAGGVAHDFNNLLSVISASLAVAEAAPTLPPDAREALATAGAAVSRAATLTRQLLAYAGKTSRTKGPVDLRRLVGELGELLPVSLPRSVRFEKALEEDVPPVLGDEAELQQVVMNLITNAAEAIGPNEGTVTLRLRRAAVKGRPAAVLEVKDTGAGMTSEVKARLFDPFFSTKGTGRGLGLAAMAGILKSHGATVDIDSAPGRGTTFTLTFPALDEALTPPERSPSSPSAAKRPPPGLAVLVVDDEPLMRQSVRRLLSTWNCAVREASSGEEALTAIRGAPGHFDLVLMDITMPGLSGVDAAKRAFELEPSLPVVLSSGYPEDHLEGVSLPPTVRLLGKPYRAEQLEALLLVAGQARATRSG